MHSSPCSRSMWVVLRRSGRGDGFDIGSPRRVLFLECPMRLGLDMFSLRSQGWSPFEQLDFAARWGVAVAHYSEIRLLGGLDSDHLRRVGAYAEERGIALELGMLSICPTSGIFAASKGSAETQIAAMLP